jgi:ABC-2 type transport system permease protein
MRQMVHAEILKVRTLRSFWWMALALLLAVPILLATNVVTVDSVPGRLDTSEGVRNVFSGASPPLMLIVGIMLMAGEFRHGTATATFLASPIRSRVLAAKLIAAALLGALLAVPASALALGVGLPWLDAKNVDLGAHVDDIAITLAGGVGALVLYALIGVGLGALVRNQTAAISAALIWTFIVEGAVTAFADNIGRWLPGAAAAAMTGGVPQESHLLPMWAGALVFAGYGLAFAAAGAKSIGRRGVG